MSWTLLNRLFASKKLNMYGASDKTTAEKDLAGTPLLVYTGRDDEPSASLATFLRQQIGYQQSFIPGSSAQQQHNPIGRAGMPLLQLPITTCASSCLAEEARRRIKVSTTYGFLYRYHS